MSCTALVLYADRWAVEDSVLDFTIFLHDMQVLQEMSEEVSHAESGLKKLVV